MLSSIEPKTKEIKIASLRLRRESLNEWQQLGVFAVKAYRKDMFAGVPLAEIGAIARKTSGSSFDTVRLKAPRHRELVSATPNREI